MGLYGFLEQDRLGEEGAIAAALDQAMPGEQLRQIDRSIVGIIGFVEIGWKHLQQPGQAWFVARLDGIGERQQAPRLEYAAQLSGDDRADARWQFMEQIDAGDGVERFVPERHWFRPSRDTHP